MLVGLVGIALLADSLFVAALAALHVAWVLLLPFAEERWLREQFGDEYDEYVEQVPRFVGWRTLRGEYVRCGRRATPPLELYKCNTL
jgi:protein-S-isoprenylcysteine O-methyltransferase Ste14